MLLLPLSIVQITGLDGRLFWQDCKSMLSFNLLSNLDLGTLETDIFNFSCMLLMKFGRDLWLSSALSQRKQNEASIENCFEFIYCMAIQARVKPYTPKKHDFCRLRSERIAIAARRLSCPLPDCTN